MSVETSEMTIVNEALLQLGLPPLSNLDDDSDAATRVVRRVINQRRRAFLANNSWNFSTVQGVATLLDDITPLADYTACYAPPGDCLYITRVGSDDNPINQSEWNYQGGKLLYSGDAATLPIEYRKDETDYSLWSPLCVDAFMWGLAAHLARPLTKDLKRATDAGEQALIAYREAAAVDLQERPSYVSDASRTQRAREWFSSSSSDFTVDQSVLDE